MSAGGFKYYNICLHDAYTPQFIIERTIPPNRTYIEKPSRYTE